VKGIGSNATAKQRPPNAPLAIIMEVGDGELISKKKTTYSS
jgi:hypothetical protein